MKLRLCALLGLAICGAGCAKVEVVHLRPDATKLAAEGVFYALPRTVIRAQLKVERKEATGAPFTKYAGIFAPGSKPACLQETCAAEFALKEGAVLSTFGEPDPAHVYMVKFSNGRTLDQKLSMAWNESGILSTAAASVTNRAVDVTLAGLNLVAGMGTRLALGATVAVEGTEKGTKYDVCASRRSDNDKWVISTLGGTDQMSPDASATLIANYCDLKPDVRESLSESYDRPRIKAAREAYAIRIEPLQSALQNQLSGQSAAADPIPVIGRLEGQISDQLKALYLGTAETKVWDASFDVSPDSPSASEGLPLLVVDKTKGVCVKGELAPESKALPAAFKPVEGGCEQRAPNVTLLVDFHPRKDKQLFSVVQASTELPTKALSFRYRIPAQVKASVEYQESGKSTSVVQGSAVFSLAQFGHVVSLPAKRNAKSLEYDLAFVEATGGLKSFKLGSTGAMDAAALDSASGVVNSALDARTASIEKTRAAREKEAAAAAAEVDELNVLTRQAAILKLKHEICELQKKYGLPCDSQ